MSSSPLYLERWSPEAWGGPEKLMERVARVSYRSEGRITDASYKTFLHKYVLSAGHRSIAEHAGSYVFIPYSTMCVRLNQLLEILSINPLIPYHMGSEGLHILVNGHQVLELMEQAGWCSTAKDRYVNVLARTILNAVADYFPTLLSEYPRGPVEPGVTAEEAHRVRPEAEHSELFTLATYYVKGLSRVTETQWVRHRRMSFNIMSGRGVDFSTQPVVIPTSCKEVAEGLWVRQGVEKVQEAYTLLRGAGVSRQDARYVLPQGISTEICCTATLKWWNYFFKLRCLPPAQWEIRAVANAIQTDLHERYPTLVDAAPEPTEVTCAEPNRETVQADVPALQGESTPDRH